MSDYIGKEALASIRPVKEAVEDQLLAKAGVVAVDLGEKVSRGKGTGEPSIVVFVETKKPESELKGNDLIPPEIDQVKTDVQELKVELQPAKKLLGADAQVDGTAYATLTGGISMGPARSVFLTPPDVANAGNYVFVGTLGALVRDRGSGSTMALTNFHVACVNDGWAVGDRMVQPSRVDGGNIATQQFGSLSRAVLTENTDGAVVALDDGHAWDYTVTGIGDIVGSAVAAVGTPVQKRGRTTEHTFGTVASTDFTVSIPYGDGLGTRTLRHQIRIDTNTTLSTRFSEKGDSGSVVMDMNRNVVGLLFGGATNGSMTFANPIAVALDELQVDLLVRPPVVRTRPILDCLDTRLSVCDVVTRPAVCELPPTRHIVCNVLTRTPSCILTRSVSCILTRSRCPSRTVVCEITTRGGCPGDVIKPDELLNPKLVATYGAQYGASEVTAEADYWAGYLASLEEIAAAEEHEEGENR